MKPKIFYGILSTIIGISFGFMLYLISVNNYSSDQLLLAFLVVMGIFSGVPAIILSIIHILQIEKQKQKENKKNDSKTSPDVESTDKKNDSMVSSTESKNDKNFLGVIQERLAKGDISLGDYTELKNELSS